MRHNHVYVVITDGELKARCATVGVARTFAGTAAGRNADGTPGMVKRVEWQIMERVSDWVYFDPASQSVEVA